MSRASMTVELPSANIIVRLPEKRSARQMVWVTLTVEQAANLMEAGWDVRCLTPGTVVNWAHIRRVTDEYVLYIEVAISPFWDRYADVTRWIIPEMIKADIPAKMTIELAIVSDQPMGEARHPYLRDIQETDVEAELRRRSQDRRDR